MSPCKRHSFNWGLKSQRLMISTASNWGISSSVGMLTELCTLMMKSLLELPKLVQHLAGYVEVFGTKVESDLTQS